MEKDLQVYPSMMLGDDNDYGLLKLSDLKELIKQHNYRG